MSETLFSVYNELKNNLEKAGIPDFVFEAKQIIKAVTGYSNREVLEHYNDAVTEYQKSNIAVILRQREIHYPLQYALGFWDCFGYQFKVGPGVLIPRADTETVIEKAVGVLKDKKNAEVLDLCTGTGCIGISIAKEIPDSTVLLLEKYPEAAVYAQENITLNRAFNATLKLGDIFEGTLNDKKYDLIVSNPPYVTSEEMTDLQAELTYEPETALAGGDDGLDFYKAITKNYVKALKSGGMLMFEIGQKQADAVKQILCDAGLKDVTVQKDIEDRDRVVFGTAN